MSEKWVQVSLKQAEQHRLYGIKGWLLVFLVASLLGFVLFLSQTVSGVAGAKLNWETLSRANPNAANFLLFSGIINLAVVLAIFTLAFEKHKAFRLVSIFLLAGGFPVQYILSLVFPFTGAGAALGQDAIGWLLASAIWISYLQLSRRVRVTFENTIRSDELVQSGVSVSAQYSSASSSSPSSDDWASALDEYESDKRDKGLWAKLYAENNGDEAKTKAGYLSIRAARLSDARLAGSRLSGQSQEGGGAS